MGKVMVNYSTVMEFSKKFKVESKKLDDILANMRQVCINFQDMVDTNAGNLYKEVMINELEKERDLLNKTSEKISKEFENYANLFKEKDELIHERVGKSNG